MPAPSFSPDDARPLAPGVEVGGYQIVALLGEGASSRVYLADRGGQRFALKMLSVRGAGPRARLEMEARALSLLRHPNIIRAWGVVEDRGLLGLALDYVPGQTLATRLARGRVSMTLGMDLAAQLLSAVAAAHALDLIHQDLKPSNLLLDTRDGETLLRLADFGLARSLQQEDSLTLSGARGTLGYLAPEQLLSDSPRVDKRTDVYALGVVLYELLCGVSPFTGDRLAVLNAAARGDFIRPLTHAPGLPAHVDMAIAAALEPNPDRRVPDAQTLLQLFHGRTDAFVQAAALPMMAFTPSATPRPIQPARSRAELGLDAAPSAPALAPPPARGGWALWVAGALIAALLVGIGASAVGGLALGWGLSSSTQALPSQSSITVEPRTLPVPVPDPVPVPVPVPVPDPVPVTVPVTPPAEPVTARPVPVPRPEPVAAAPRPGPAPRPAVAPTPAPAPEASAPAGYLELPDDF